MRNPWDQQLTESSKAFERFALYRDMGTGRSLRKLAKDLELNPSTLAEISKKHAWQERVAAFDAYIDKASQYNQIAQVRIMKRRQIALALRAQKVAEKGLKKFLRDMDDEHILITLTFSPFLPQIPELIGKSKLRPPRVPIIKNLTEPRSELVNKNIVGQIIFAPLA